jgi:hypothetical protein
MSLRVTNPTDSPHLPWRLAEQANNSLHTRNGGGERRSCGGVISDAKGLADVAGFSRGDADEGFALERVCRYVSRLCSGTASGLFMRPAAARSSASAAPPSGLRFPSKSCSERPPKRFLRSLRKCRASALGSMVHSLNGAPTKIGRFNKRRQSCTRTK